MSNILDNKFIVGANIWKIAEKQGFKKILLSKELGIRRQTFDNWIKGESHPSIEDVKKASILLGVDVSVLISEEDLSMVSEPKIPYPSSADLNSKMYIASLEANLKANEKIIELLEREVLDLKKDTVSKYNYDMLKQQHEQLKEEHKRLIDVNIKLMEDKFALDAEIKSLKKIHK